MTADTSLIPVMDLLGGQVVRGVRGDRQAYRPIESALCRSSDPATVAQVLCTHCAATRLYVADLDALMGGPAQFGVLHTLLEAVPGIELWLDAGFADAAAAAALMTRLGNMSAPHVVPVYGSESLRSREAMAQAFDRSDELGARAALSLDRRDGRPLDPAGCWEAPELWPQRVIVMTLERVGTGAGPDLETLRSVRQRAPAATVIGAGGIRGPEDLAPARQAGADAWLVASALHDLQLPPAARAAS
ncbi:HisA/HisF-related TIM barrel protein [Aquincola sp. MAHUQ-54]|uniref:HisA/HisF-related TIM barrel protein n=1 Tax=Aquincola agrisoli TaxID=3119538 RepID=A0AAW9Q6Y5_9BURK